MKWSVAIFGKCSLLKEIPDKREVAILEEMLQKMLNAHYLKELLEAKLNNHLWKVLLHMRVNSDS
jgi:hypothetical protein